MFRITIPSMELDFSNNDIVNAFDPRENRLWMRAAQQEGTLTWAQYIEMLKAIYTPENIRAFPGAFFPKLLETYTRVPGLVTPEQIRPSENYGFGQSGMGDTINAAFASIVSAAPVDKLWVLHFCGPKEIVEGNKLLFQTVGIRTSSSYYHDNGNLALNIDWARHQFQYSFRGDNFVTEFASFLTGLEGWVLGLIPDEEARNGTFFDSDNYSGVNHSLIDRLISYFAYNAASFAETSNGSPNRHTPEQLAQRQTVNFSVYFRTDYMPKIRVEVVYQPGDREPLYELQQHSANPLSFLPKSIVGKKTIRTKTGKKKIDEVNPRLFGVELELSTDYNLQTLIDAQDTLFAIGKHDISISGTKRNPVEMVTCPMSKRAHIKQWAKFLSNLEYRMFDCSRDTTNGLHIHVDLKEFGINTAQPEVLSATMPSSVKNSDGTINTANLRRLTNQSRHLRNFLWFLADPANRKFLLFVSERDERSWNEWSRTPTLGTNRSAEYAKIVGTWFSPNQRNGRDNNRLSLRGAAHFTSYGTLEVRMFRGFVSFASIIKGIDFVDALINFTSTASFKQLTFLEFVKWLGMTSPTRYKFLKMFIEEASNGGRKIDEMEVSSEVDALIMSERNPDAIIDMYESAGVMPSRKHIAYLNSLFPKKTFDLVADKRTKELKFVTLASSKTPVAKFDKALQEIYTKGYRRPDFTPATGTIQRKKGIPRAAEAARSTYEERARSQARGVRIGGFTIDDMI